MTRVHPLLATALSGTTLYVLAVVFVATLIRSAIGFGEALFAVPLLALRLPLEVAAPLAVLISITIALIVVAQDWRKVHARSVGWLIFATIFGIPVGLALLTSSHQSLVKAALALLIIAFSLYSLIGSRPPELTTDSLPWLLGCGFTAGILGGAYGMNGPPLAIYGAMRRWSAQQFRATLQGYFLPASILGMIGYWLKGLWTARGDALLSVVTAAGHSGNPARQVHQPSPSWPFVPEIRLLRAGGDWSGAAGAVLARLNRWVLGAPGSRPSFGR